jgi:enoyl-CoA hydratase
MPDLLVEHPAPHVVRVRLNRPDKRNALSVALRTELLATLQALADDADVRALVLAGGDKVFAAGADLAEIETAGAVDMVLRATHKLWAAFGRLGKPMIASVRGAAFGGGLELAMRADLIVAGDRARFGLPEIRVGLIPGGGGTQRLVRLVGRHRALGLLLTGDAIDAGEAHRLGLVHQVVADADCDAAAVALAVRIAAMPPLAVQQIREVVALGEDAPIETAMMLEHKALQLLCASEDKREGIRAFFEKRPPVFEGR